MWTGFWLGTRTASDCFYLLDIQLIWSSPRKLVPDVYYHNGWLYFSFDYYAKNMPINDD